MISDIFAGIKALILANFPDYPTNCILQGNQNNTVMPQNGKQVIMTAFDNETETGLPLYNYDATLEIETFTTLADTMFYIDFYGSPAQETARTFKLILESNYAKQFFYENNYPCSVHRVYPVKNLTRLFGREMYLPRFLVKCFLFNNIQFSTSSLGVSSITPTVRFAPVQKAE